MSHAEKCPICSGTGKVETAHPLSGIYAPEVTTCHGCGGKGWVEIEDELQAGYWQCPTEEEIKNE